MKRKLFCEISPLTYKISVKKCILQRKFKDFIEKNNFAEQKSDEKLEFIIYSHNSLIRRKLGNVDLQLQDNKAVNLSLTTPKITNVLIKPGEIFSFWYLAGDLTEQKGYKVGLTISNGQAKSGIGGGMCQFTNLIHWMVLHTPMQIIEHHHHEKVDLFPDFNRKIPFGTGTSISYNYVDYRFKNTTESTFQLICYTDDTYLRGELRADKKPSVKYHIKVEDEFFSNENDIIYRNGKVFRTCVDVITGNILYKELIRENHAIVMYDIQLDN
ncbi:MAG: VanW family protein [Clostridia bacterium]